MTKRIFLAPLDWGMGHATRCVPIIHALRENGAEVILGASGKGYTFFRQEFPELELQRLPDYDIHYTYKGLRPFHFLKQLPGLMKTIQLEQRWLQQFIRSRHIAGIISDNRFGIYSRDIPNVCISHQLHVKAPFLSLVAAMLHRKFLNRFDEIWVPDTEGTDNLSGELSHGVDALRSPVKYIGSLSRISVKSNTAVENSDQHILVVLSGPEPQRTILEEKLLPQLVALKKRIVIIRGLPDEQVVPILNDQISVHNHLSGDELQKVFHTAEFIISRSGYSTLCDAASARKRIIVIPTPGQTEQEYLADYLAGQNRLVMQQQADPDLHLAITKLMAQRPLHTNTTNPELIVQAFLSKIGNS
jgi:uncharacterized protein (TIGR00661 family)